MKKQTPKITWWTDQRHNGLIYNTPPVSATKCFPKIFKDMPPSNPDISFPTAKKCPAFIDLYKHAYIIPMWCDVILTYDVQGYRWETPTDEFSLDIYGHNQFLDYLPMSKKDWHFVWKFHCPWFLKTPKGYSVLQLPLTYEFNPDFEVLSGVIDTDIHHEVNQQVVQKRVGTIEIHKGTPLCMYIPFKREKFEAEAVLETEELWISKIKNYWNMVTTFGNKKSRPSAYREAQRKRDE